MTRIGTKDLPDTMTALEVLRQAGDWLEISYWMKGNEFSFHNEVIVQDAGESKGLKVHGLNSKARGVPPVYITQMCSVGAIAMSRCTAMPEDERIAMNVDYLFESDLFTTAACYALADTILSVLPDAGYRDGDNVSTAPIDTITGWNDDEERTRDEVVAVFRLAEKHPLLAPGVDAVWWLNDDTNEETIKRWAFPSEQRAYAFLSEVERAEEGKLDRWSQQLKWRMAHGHQFSTELCCSLPTPAAV